jgi:hypothetical protein
MEYHLLLCVIAQIVDASLYFLFNGCVELNIAIKCLTKKSSGQFKASRFLLFAKSRATLNCR